MGPCRSLCVFMDSNVFLWVLIGLYTSLLVLTGPYRFLYVVTDSKKSLWVLIGTYSF